MIEYNFDIVTGRVESDVYVPDSRGPHGAIVLLLGAVGFPRREPIIVRLLDGISRAGAVVMVVQSSGLQNGVIDPREVDGLVEAVRFLADRPEVDPHRIGIFGFSVGGSLAILAAEDPRLRDRLAFVNAFGAYYDARDFLQAVVSGRIDTEAGSQPWQPSDLTLWVMRKQLIEPLPEGTDRTLLNRLFIDKDESARQELGGLSAEGRVLESLMDRSNPGGAEQEIGAMPAVVRRRLQDISPSYEINLIRTRLYLMHDRSDGYIPYTESRKLAAAAPPGTLRAYAEFNLFSHVMPDRPLAAFDFSREAWKLYWHAYQVCLEIL